MGRLKLIPDPTFSAKVAIPQAGGEDELVGFVFKHRTRDDLDAFIKASADRDEVDTILEMCSGWELSDAFTRESLNLLRQNYITSPRAIFDKYIDELTKQRAKN